eukprot:766769-Hanusia_phi.AAC.4
MFIVLFELPEDKRLAHARWYTLSDDRHERGSLPKGGRLASARWYILPDDRPEEDSDDYDSDMDADIVTSWYRPTHP